MLPAGTASMDGANGGRAAGVLNLGAAVRVEAIWDV